MNPPCLSLSLSLHSYFAPLALPDLLTLPALGFVTCAGLPGPSYTIWPALIVL